LEAPLRQVHPSLDSSLTEWEWLGLSKQYNLADAHVHLTLRPDQRQVVRRTLEFFDKAQAGSVQAHQRRFLDAFGAAAGQAALQRPGRSPVLHYSSSVSLDVSAKALAALGHRRVALICPTFDNIPLLLRRSGLRLLPVDGHSIWGDRDYLRKHLRRSDALFLVAPNNPDGVEPTRQEFEAVVEECMRYRRTLVVDFSFRFFSALPRWDQYRLVEDAVDLQYIFIEDTGKTWPTAELKTGIVTSSSRIQPTVQLVSDELLLDISPVTLQLLEQLIKLDLARGVPGEPLTMTTCDLVRENRDTLREAMKEVPVGFPYAHSRVSVEWIQLTDAAWNSAELAAWLAKRGIAVLPGQPFFWNSSRHGNSFLRVALMRDSGYFGKAAEVLAGWIRGY
jgi:aspartate/methionine/tyrosine aminotransferase